MRQSGEVFVRIRSAGILSVIAVTAIALQGSVPGTEVEPMLGAVAVSTALFCAIGYVVGAQAGWIVRDSVRMQTARESAALGIEPRRVRSASD